MESKENEPTELVKKSPEVGFRLEITRNGGLHVKALASPQWEKYLRERNETPAIGETDYFLRESGLNVSFYKGAVMSQTGRFDDTQLPAVTSYNGKNYINLAIFRMVGIGTGEGVSFHVNQLSTPSLLQDAMKNTMVVLKEFYTEYIKKVKFVVTISSDD